MTTRPLIPDTLAELQHLFAEHRARLGPITSSWTCPCGAASTNGSLHNGDVTSPEQRQAELDKHLADQVAAFRDAVAADLRSRLACAVEASYWDRPYDTRLAAIRGMCDLTTNGMTPDPRPESDAEIHPESYCHRCNGPNFSWFTPGAVWDPVMRPNADGEWLWHEIICPPCFVELAGGGTFHLIPAQADGERWTGADERAEIVRSAREQVLKEAAKFLRGQGSMRFDEAGPRDARGAALWDAGCGLDPDDGDALRARADRAGGS